MTQTLDRQYAIDVPEILNYIDLEKFSNEYKRGFERHSPEFGVRAWGFKGDDPLVNKLDSIINKSLLTEEIAYWYQIKDKDKELTAHVDSHFRNVALIIPIDPKVYDIQWFDTIGEEANIIHTYTYQGPTLIDSDKPHGTLDKELERHIFQLSLSFRDYSWDKVIELYESNQLFKI
tara:strand:+ start:350 stop:877 length:528 start_codon:yes stop_codon:yes gene_type:complete